MLDLSQEFKQSVINRYNKAGEEWLNDVDKITEKYIEKFNLSNVELLKDLSMNILMFATSMQYGDIAIKIGSPSLTIKNEISYIKNCNSKYFEKCYYYNQQDRVLLLERIKPGYCLDKLENQEERIDVFCNILNSLLDENIPKDEFKYYEDEFLGRVKLIKNDKEKYKEILPLLDKAIAFYDEIKNMNLPKYVLHEDLQHKNILKSEEGWKVIDPHGTIAEKIFEVALFIRNEAFYTNFKEIDKVVTSISEKINEDKTLIYKASYVYLFSKIGYHIKVKTNHYYIEQDIKLCNKLLEYI